MATTRPSVARYALYKKGTDRLVEYFTTTATACRRRITAKATQSSKVHTNDLLKWAEFISAWNPPPEVPVSIIELTDDVIIGRTTSSDIYSSLHTTPTAQEVLDDEGHQYFTQILREVRQLLNKARLRGRKLHRDTSQEVLDTPTTSLEALANLYELLQVEEPSEAAWETQMEQEPKVEPTSTLPVLEVNEEEEKRFALSCFLLDLQEIRTFVLEAWDEYRRGEISLNVSAQLTETALGIIRRAEDVFTARFPEFAHYDAVLACFGYAIDHDGKSCVPKLVSIATGETLEPTSSAAVLLCPDGALIMRDLHRSWLKLAFDTPGEHQIDAREMKAPRASTDDELCYHFAHTMTQLSVDLYDVISKDRTAEQTPEFEKALGMLATADDVRMCAVNGCQIYMHIHDILEDHLDAGCVSIVESIREFDANAARLYKFMAVFRKGSCVAHPFLQRLQDWECRASNWLDLLRPSESLEVWRHLPALTASWMNGRVVGLHMMGLEWASTGEHVMTSMGHLYNAGRQLGLISTAWEDMEWMLREHSTLVLDFGQKRNSGRFAAQHYLATGMPISLLAVPAQKLRGDHRIRAIKELSSGSQYLNIERNQAASDKALGYQRAELQEVTLQKLTEKTKVVKLPGKKSKQAYHSPDYTGIQLLHTFKKFRLEDETRMNFDYLAFWLGCAGLLETLSNESHGWAPKIAAGMADDLSVDTLLRDADEHEQQNIARQGEFSKAASIMSDYIEKNGSQCTSKAADLSKGYEPSRMLSLARALQLTMTAIFCQGAGHLSTDGAVCSNCEDRFVGNCDSSGDLQTDIFGPTDQGFGGFQATMMEILDSVMKVRFGDDGGLSSKPRSAHAATVEDAAECDCNQGDCEECAVSLSASE